jgi:hypothetical protein
MGNIKTGDGFKPTPAQKVVMDLTNDQEVNVLLVQGAIDAAVLAAAGGAQAVDDLSRELVDRKGLEAEVAGLRAEFEAASKAEIEKATAELKDENERLKGELSSLAVSREALKDEVRKELAPEVETLKAESTELRAEIETLKAKTLSPEAAEKAVNTPARRR